MKGTCALVACLALIATGCSGDSGGDDDGDGGVTTVRMWHGQTEVPKQTLDSLVAEFNRSHPDIKVIAESGGVTPDQMTQKITTGLAGDSYPDMAYIFGSDVANVARSPKVLDLTDEVKQPGWAWDTFWPAARESTTTADGRVRAVPAISDALGMIYNRKLFEEAGIPEPEPDWTWEDFRSIARELADPSKGQFGTSWPATGDEDTVWRIWPSVWQRGGDILADDGKAVGYGGAPGLETYELLRQMSVDDESMYLDTTAGSLKMYQLFNNGKLGMVMGGTWALPGAEDGGIEYGVVGLPGADGKHTTISGADTWMLFDNGDDRSQATIEFAQWLLEPEQELKWILPSGSLPSRESTTKLPGYRKFLKRWPAAEEFAVSQEDARARPVSEAYPEISRAVGKSLSALLLGKASAQDALDQAVEVGDQAARTP